MKRENHQHHRGGVLKLVIATGILALACATSYAQSVLGSPGAGWQTWAAIPQDLNNNSAPFWDAPTTTDPNYGGQDPGGPGKNKNIGFCLAGAGDCAAPNGLAGKPPGAIPFWGKPYNSASDQGGGLDPHVYFHSKGEERSLKARLLGNVSTIKVETNHIGWFETNATGSVIGKLHQLFQGGHSKGNSGQGLPPPSPIGSTVNFTPTEYFGFYFIDVSEGSCISATLEDLAASLPNNSGCGSLSDPAWLHNMVVFGKSGKRPRYYIAGEDPPGCGDSDCNLTVIKITQTDDDERDE
jgi:hypothetical protein